MFVSLKTKISTPLWRECADFYRLIFNMQVVEEWNHADDKGVILAFHDGSGEAYLELYHAETEHDVSALSLQFKVDAVADFIESLPDYVDYEGPTPRPWGSTYVYLRDPAGVMIVVFEGGL